MFHTPTKLLVALVATILVAGLTPTLAGAQPSDDEVDGLLQAEPDSPHVEAPHEGLIVFSADARIDGHRVDDELYLALGYNEQHPFLASLWLLVDAETDDWAPICFGWLVGDADRAVFVGESTIGDEDDGCLIVPLGDEEDDAGVAFGVVELEGESVATAAMYAIG
ncbi:MAG: hypothetical protein ACR2QK_18390 [Acidimicrobiales bacterium]